MKIGVIAGSFDPITRGHSWLIDRGVELTDLLYIVVGINHAKKYTFTLDERIAMVEQSYKMEIEAKRVEVVTTGNMLLVDYAARIARAQYLVRGIRNAVDFQYEQEMQQLNAEIQPDIRTVFFMSPPNLATVSSSVVKSVVGWDGWQTTIRDKVDPHVLRALEERLTK